MRIVNILVVVSGLFCACAVAGPFVKNQTPIYPPSRVTVELDGKVIRRGFLPLRLTFYSDDDKSRKYMSSDFMFEVLDEHGTQVGGPSVFTRDAVLRPVDLSGKIAVYQPRLAIGLGDSLKVGQEYELVAAMPSAGLMGAARFTLGNETGK